MVIGIIALLLSILLPTLGKARDSAKTVKCLSNLRSLGQVALLYSNDYKQKVVPTIVWGNSRTAPDFWPNLLVSGNYISRQEDDRQIPGGNQLVPGIDYSTILVCPSVQDVVTADSPNIPGGRRVPSDVIQPGTGMSTDFSYAINGTTFRGGQVGQDYVEPATVVPSSSITYDDTQSYPLKSLTKVADSSSVAQFLDGREWNLFQNHSETRVSGRRHGDWKEDKPSSTGRVNITFYDGHSETVARENLPGLEAEGEDGNGYAWSVPLTEEAREYLATKEGAKFRLDY